MMPLDRIFLWFLFYSFCGWIYESILVSIQQRRPVNRGFLNGPLCPIYGVGAVGAALLFGGIRNPLALFAAGAIGASALEYFVSWAMERLFHARWWDYSDFRLNLNGRICLLGAVIFGVFSILIVKYIQPVVAGWTDALPWPVTHWLSVVLFCLTVFDIVITVVGVMDLDNSLDEIVAVMAKYGDSMREAMSGASTKVGESLQAGRDRSAELMLRVRDTAGAILNRQQRRMIASFPKLRTERNEETLRQLREIFERLYRRRNGDQRL